jgi:hypothetical protein
MRSCRTAPKRAKKELSHAAIDIQGFNPRGETPDSKNIFLKFRISVKVGLLGSKSVGFGNSRGAAYPRGSPRWSRGRGKTTPGWENTIKVLIYFYSRKLLRFIKGKYQWLSGIFGG